MKTLLLILLVMVSGFFGLADDLAKKSDPALPSIETDPLRKGWLRAEEAAQKIDPLLKSIRDTLPKGWSVEYDKETSFLLISRDEPVSATIVGPNGPPFQDPQISKYWFAFRVKEFVTPAKYQQWVAENAKIEKEARTIYDDFEKRGLLGRGERLRPVTDADKETATRYDDLINSKGVFPDFCFQDICLSWERGGPEDWNTCTLFIKDDRIRGECDQMKEKVVKLFSKYQAPN